MRQRNALIATYLQASRQGFGAGVSCRFSIILKAPLVTKIGKTTEKSVNDMMSSTAT